MPNPPSSTNELNPFFIDIGSFLEDSWNQLGELGTSNNPVAPPNPHQSTQTINPNLAPVKKTNTAQVKSNASKVATQPIIPPLNSPTNTPINNQSGGSKGSPTAPGQQTEEEQFNALMEQLLSNNQSTQQMIQGSNTQYANTVASQQANLQGAQGQESAALAAEQSALQPYVQQYTTAQAQVINYTQQLNQMEVQKQQDLAQAGTTAGQDIGFQTAMQGTIERKYAFAESGISANIAAYTAQAQMAQNGMAMQQSVSQLGVQAAQVNYDQVKDSVNLAVQAATAEQAQNVSDLQWSAQNYAGVINALGSNYATMFSQNLGYQETLLSLAQSQMNTKLNMIVSSGLQISPDQAQGMNLYDIASLAAQNQANAITLQQQTQATQQAASLAKVQQAQVSSGNILQKIGAWLFGSPQPNVGGLTVGTTATDANGNTIKWNGASWIAQ